MSGRPSALERLANPDAFLSRGDLAELGLSRRQIDQVFRRLDVFNLPGTRHPMVRTRDFLALVDEFSYGPDRVRPTRLD